MSDCIEHMGYRNKDGYGWVTYKNKQTGAHRKAWMVAYGEIPAGMNVLHKCDNRACVNLDHLFLGTQKENVDDMIAKGRGRLGAALRKSDGLPVRAKLSSQQIAEIHLLRSEGCSQQYIANKINVSQGCISQLLLGATQYAK